MIKRRSLLILVFSLAMGIGAAWVANNWVEARMLPVEASEVSTPSVVVAALEIPYGTTIEARHLALVKMPAEAIPDGSVSELAAVEGMIAVHNFLRGEIVVHQRFADHLGGSTLSAIVDPNMRAVAVRVDDVVGVAGFLLPGNRVDVVASRKERNRATATTIVQDIRVLAVDQSTSIDKNDPIIVRAVTLEVTPEQAEALVRARQEGSIQLTLRNPNDKALYMAKTITPPEPAAAPKRVVRRIATPDPQVTLVRGTDVSTVKTKW